MASHRSVVLRFLSSFNEAPKVPALSGTNVRILITGSSGFIGRRLFDTLLHSGHDVWGMDMVPPVLESHCERFYQGDLLELDQVQDAVSATAPSAVVHLAARVDLNGKSLEEYSVNFLGTRHLIEAMSCTGNVTRCIFTSTQLVCPLGHMEVGGEYRPTTIYGESKAAMENLVRRTRGGVQHWCITRPTTVWGPGMQEHYIRFFRMIQRGRYFHVGRKPLWKSYGYIGNIVHQYGRLLEAPADMMHERVFYLADYQPISLQRWTDNLQREFGARRIPVFPKVFARIAAKAGDLIHFLGAEKFPFNSFRLNNVLTEYVYDLAATQRVCGELPYTVEAGVEETVRWITSLSEGASDATRTQAGSVTGAG